MKRICKGHNITMATSLPILQFEPFIMEDGEKLNLGIRWKKYLTKFENFLVAMNITEDKRRVAMLLHFGGDYMRDIIDNAVPKVEGYDATVEYLNKHLNPKTNDTFEIYKFQKTIQDGHETMQQFCNRLRSIANRCNFESEDKRNNENKILLIRQYLLKRRLTEEIYLRKLTNKQVLLKTAKALSKLKT